MAQIEANIAGIDGWPNQKINPTTGKPYITAQKQGSIGGTPTYTGSYGGSSGGFENGQWGSWAADTFDPFNIWHKEAIPYTVIGGSSKLSSSQNMLLDTMAQYLYDQSGQNQAYGGQLTAGINPVQFSSIADIMNYQSPTAGLKDTQNQTLMDLISGKTGMRDVMENQYMTNIENPLVAKFQNVALPALNSTFASKGLSFGTDKQTATQASTGILMDALSKGRADLESNITKSTLDAQIAGLGKANETSAQSLAEILGITGAKATAGKTIQDTEQSGLTAIYNQWLRNQPGTNPAMQEIMKLLGIDTVYDQQTITQGGKDGGGIMGLVSSIFG